MLLQFYHLKISQTTNKLSNIFFTNIKFHELVTYLVNLSYLYYDHNFKFVVKETNVNLAQNEKLGPIGRWRYPDLHRFFFGGANHASGIGVVWYPGSCLVMTDAEENRVGS